MIKLDYKIRSKTNLLLVIPQKITNWEIFLPSSDADTANTKLHFLVVFFAARMKGCHSVESSVDLNLARKAVFKAENGNISWKLGSFRLSSKTLNVLFMKWVWIIWCSLQKYWQNAEQKVCKRRQISLFDSFTKSLIVVWLYIYIFIPVARLYMSMMGCLLDGDVEDVFLVLVSCRILWWWPGITSLLGQHVMMSHKMLSQV